ncbi:MAG: RagB/SusD family nutrient uptake outer membrane protein [Prevotella sp.]|nr:RagB/SusD family nutrient uptake outer membrane protein [Prevotella sp.]
MNTKTIYRNESTKKRGMGNWLCAMLIMLPSFFLVSCSDFLDILPMNEVVLENYWTEKGDVTSVVNSCYETLENADCLTRMGVWGELRSDNLRLGANVPNEINEILKENLLPSNTMCDWSRFYEAINRCNTVCYYAPQVQAIDPNYTEEEMRANIAEATAIRALCYFYLIRTFRDVPYSTYPSIDDSQQYVIPATPFNNVLDSLINDLEKVKGDAVRRYFVDESPNAWQNSCKVTRWVVYALLADLYLWKGDWDQAIHYCDLVIDYKRQQYEEMLQLKGNLNNIALIDSIPMILEKPVGTTICGNAYTETFGTGNSFESIFELSFRSPQSVKNDMVSKFYGNERTPQGYLSASDILFKDVAQGSNSLFKKTDGRAYEGGELSGSRYTICKYVRTRVSYKTNPAPNTEKDLGLSDNIRTESDAYANWIIYRLSDMLLIKAEALIERGQGDDFDKAYALIDIVNKRANDAVSGARLSTLKKSDYIDSKAAMEELLLDERQREFLFEGKRWYDLVRVARRDGKNTRLVNLVTRKYQENVNALKIKLADPNIIYYPYAKSELKVNPLLKQNPAFTTGEDTELTR